MGRRGPWPWEGKTGPSAPRAGQISLSLGPTLGAGLESYVHFLPLVCAVFPHGSAGDPEFCAPRSPPPAWCREERQELEPQGVEEPRDAEGVLSEIAGSRATEGRGFRTRAGPPPLVSGS